MHRRRVWSETLPLDALTHPTLLQALAARNVELLAAVRPTDAALVPPLLDYAEQASARIGLWPMLEDADGRWASAHNTEPFCRFVEELITRTEGSQALTEVAIDLEPPFALTSRLLTRRARTLGLPSLARTPLAPARRRLTLLVDRLRARNLAVSAAVLPMVLFDHGGPDGTWQRLLATPVDGVPWSRVSVMAYTSLFEGWSLGGLSRTAALALLEECCHRALQRFGARAGISLGAVGTGAFGNEPTYRNVTELQEDVAVARSAGITDMTLFDLAGALRRPPSWPWIDALSTDERFPRRFSKRVRTLTKLMDLIGRLHAPTG